ncbi:MAG: type II 3-dehydroquinate dehydratase [Prevotella sp.]|nr:type II 3-dehydroquinate dehydratase [Prevotella sp.]
MRIIIINGPNLNLLGSREPSIYGQETMEDCLASLRKRFPQIKIEYFQSNHEGALVDRLQETGFTHDGIILNAAAYTHTSIALLDAIRAISAPVVEVHLSNVAAREDFRRHSTIAPACAGTITGFGMDGYRLALEALIGLTHHSKARRS